MKKWRPYPKYKPSGIEWLGEIPVHWEVKRLRHVAAVNPVKSEVAGWPSDTEVSFVPMEALCEFGGLILDETRLLGDIYQGYTFFRDGDVIIAKITPCFENGKGSIAQGLSNGVGFGTTELHVIRPRSELDVNFFFYFSISSPFRRLGEAEMYGAGGQKRVPDSFVRNYQVPLPRLSEQRAIATFLDRETARIDALIEKKERQIELLQEKRTALISHAVTKGLNPNVKMKDSGVEWLGEIPEHWETFVLRRVATRIQTGSTPPTAEDRYYENGNIPWYGPGSFGIDLVLTSPAKLIAQEAVRDGVARLFDRGSAMIVTIGATIGKVGYIDHEASCNQQITVVTFDKRKVAGKFASYQLKRLEPVLQGIAPSTTLPIMTQHQVGDLPFALPPLGEQKDIVAYIDAKAGKIDTLVRKIRESINTLREYRTALITAAVTGKIDVRLAAAENTAQAGEEAA